MIKNADIVIDTQGRPILVVPAKLSEGQTVLNLSDTGFEVTVNGNPEVQMEKIADEFLMTLGLHNKVGISVQAEGAPMPDTIDYVADVKLKVANNK